MKEMWERVPAP